MNPQTLNLYSYTANDPANRDDPNGTSWGFIGALFSFLASFFRHTNFSFNFNFRGIPFSFGFQGHFRNIYVGVAGFNVQVTGEASIFHVFRRQANDAWSQILAACTAKVSQLLENYALRDGSGKVSTGEQVSYILDFAAGRYNSFQTGFAVANSIQETQWFLKMTEPISTTCNNYLGGCNYRGRGHTHITHDSGYAAIGNYFAEGFGAYFVSNPDKLAEWPFSVTSMNAYFNMHGVLDILLNSPSYLEARRKINPHESLNKKITGAKISQSLGDRLSRLATGVSDIVKDCGIYIN